MVAVLVNYGLPASNNPFNFKFRPYSGPNILYTPMKLYITSLFCIFFLSVFSQHKTILNSKTKQPVPYAGVYVTNYMGASADDRGVFTLPKLHDSTMVRLSSVGYKDLVVRSGKLADTILMDEEVYKLDEVKIYATGKKVVKVDKLKRSSIQLSMCPPYKTRFVGKTFLYNETYKETLFIKSVSIRTTSDQTNGLLNVRFFSLNDKGEPGESIYNHNNVFSVQEGEQITTKIDVSHYMIPFPEKGLCVGVETMLLEQNKVTLYYDTKAGEMKEVIIYEPALKVSELDKDEPKRTWCYNGEKWIVNEKHNLVMQLELMN